MHQDENSNQVDAPESVAIIGYGFIGQRVAEIARSRGASVTVVARRDCDVPAGVRLVQGDAADREIVGRALHDADHVVFAAGTSRPAESDADPIAECDANIRPLLCVLEEVAQNNARHVTYLSSGGTVYGPSAPEPATEDAPLWPISAYGIAKVTAERFVGRFAQVHGFSADILRCANVYGPGQPTSGSQGVIGVFKAALEAGEPITIYGDGSARRDYVFVDDVADVALRLAVARDGLRVFNVGSGRSVSIREIITALAASIDVDPIITLEPARPSDAPAVTLDIERLRATLDYRPRDIEAGLAAAAAIERSVVTR